MHARFLRRAGALLLLTSSGATQAAAVPPAAAPARVSWATTQRLEGDERGAAFGQSLANLGDLDGDGIEDLATGWVASDGVGRVRLSFLHADGTERAWRDLTPELLGLDPGSIANFGCALAPLSDLDKNGVEDLAIGLSGADGIGSVCLVFLETEGRVARTRQLPEDGRIGTRILRRGDRFGRALASIGDLDGDGIPELLVGAPGDDRGGTNSGVAWVLSLQRSGAVRSSVAIGEGVGGFSERLASSAGFGSSVQRGPDLDGDGTAEILVGAPRNLDADAKCTSGSVHLLFLNTDGRVRASRGLRGLPLAVGDGFGSALLAERGLIDGRARIWVGAPGDDDNPWGTNERDLERGAVWELELDAEAAVVSRTKWSAGPGSLPLHVRNGDRFGSALAFARPIGLPGDDVLAGRSRGLLIGAPGGSGRLHTLHFAAPGALPPQAGFEAEVVTGEAPLEVAFVDASEGDRFAWSWDFGDGETSREAAPVHVFRDPGTYSVRLRVRGPGGETETERLDFVHVTVPPAPIAGFRFAPDGARAPADVSFFDEGGGTVVRRLWDFGDGATSTETEPVHHFDVAGTFPVRLEVIGPGDVRDVLVRQVEIAAPLAPAVDWTASVRRGEAPLEVRFEDATTGVVSSWDWDLGDGSRASSASPVHTFTTTGVYPITLAVRGPGGTDARSRAAWIEVLPRAPVGIAAGDFEGVPAGARLPTAWRVEAGDAHRVRTVGAGPRPVGLEGAGWLEVSSAGSGDRPGRLSCRFRVPAGRPVLSFLAGPAPTTGSSPGTKAAGLALVLETPWGTHELVREPNGERRRFDLFELFPAADLETVFTLVVTQATAQAPVVARGALDDLRFEARPGWTDCDGTPAVLLGGGNPRLGQRLLLGARDGEPFGLVAVTLDGHRGVAGSALELYLPADGCLIGRFLHVTGTGLAHAIELPLTAH